MIPPKNRRLADLETVLLWEGEIDNQRIREIFGVKAVQASRLLTELASTMSKQTARASAHAPLKLLDGVGRKTGKLSPEAYLQIISSASPVADDEAQLEDIRRDLSVVAPTVFAPILQAMRRKLGIQIIYRSMNHPDGLTRTVFPHALVRSPRRWHIRAWCVLREEFRDFTLGRISEAILLQEAACKKRADDSDWNESITLKVIPHPKLTPAQQGMIASEYFPGASALQLKVRRCLAKYVIQDLRLSINSETQLPPEFQLYIHNAKKLSLF